LAEAPDVVPELGADLQTVCLGLFSAAPRVVEAHCLDEQPSAQEHAPRSDDWVPAGAEAPDARAAHCLDVTASAPEPAQVVTVLVQAESVQISRGSEPVGSGLPEFFSGCLQRLCSLR
jgi:hypothetical protein